MVSVAEQLRPRHSDPIDAPGDERAFGEVADVLELDVVRAARRYAEDARGR